MKDELSRRRRKPVRESWLFWLALVVVGSLWTGGITLLRRWLEAP